MRNHRAESHGLAVGAFVSLLTYSGPDATAQPTPDARTVLEEIVVVARRREENLQDLPLSIAALTADTIAAEGLVTIEDVGELVPNLTLTTGDRANLNQIFIRGIGGGSHDPVFPIGTSMYIDGHYIPDAIGGYMSTLDVERVEVLRGPQGTLFGKNTTGGALNIISAKPAPEFQSAVKVRAGEFGERNVRGMLNVPLGDSVFARVSAASEQLDGYYYNRYLDTDADGRDHEAINGALRLTPGEQWTIDMALNLSRTRDGEKGGQCAPGDEPWSRGRGVRYGDDENQTRTYAECNLDRTLGPFVNSSGKYAFSNVTTEGLLLSANWTSNGDLGGLANLDVRTSASYRAVDYEYMHDRDYMPLDMFAIGTGSEPRTSITRGAEVLVEATVNDRLDVVTGVHYFYEETGTDRCYRLFVELLASSDADAEVRCEPFSGTIFENAPAADLMGGNNTAVYNTSVGVFGHLTYSLSDRWQLEAGLRYTEDEREFLNMEMEFLDVGQPTPSAFASFDPIVSRARVFASNNGAATFSEFTPTISLARQLGSTRRMDAGMFYLRYAEGFLTGGFNTELAVDLFPLLTPLQAYEPEHVDNYEIGFKGTFAGGRLRFNTALFYMDYTDKQDRVTIDNSDGRFGNDPVPTLIGVTANVSEVEIYGLELELRAQPWRNGSIAADVGFLHNEYGEYDSIDDNLDLIDLSNVRISDLSPEWTANLKVLHVFSLPNGATLTPMIGVYWQSEYEWLNGLDTDAPPSFCFQGNYSKWRTRLTYEPPSGTFQLSLFGNNVTDTLYYEHCRDYRGLFLYRHAPPAAWGVEFSRRWGH